MATDVDGMMIQMTLPMAVSAPFGICLISSSTTYTAADRMTEKASIFIISALLFGDILMVSVDQQVMLDGRRASTNMMIRVFMNIDFETEPEDGFVFIGRPADNPQFMKDELWWKANDYARYGNFFIGSDGNTQSYYGLLRDSGIDVPFNWNAQKWHELEALEEVIKMPMFPIDGYIRQIGDTTVIKLSN